MSINRWIKKMWYIYTMECYSAIKRKKSESAEVRWMKLKLVIQGEVELKRGKYCILVHTYGI